MFGNQHDSYFRHNAKKLSCGDIVGKREETTVAYFFLVNQVWSGWGLSS